MQRNIVALAKAGSQAKEAGRQEGRQAGRQGAAEPTAPLFTPQLYHK